jgi:hypothetical protein
VPNELSAELMNPKASIEQYLALAEVQGDECALHVVFSGSSPWQVINAASCDSAVPATQRPGGHICM